METMGFDRGEYSTVMALKLQTCTQIPQRMQVAWSIRCACRLSPLIAFTGQLREQTVQPVQTGD